MSVILSAAETITTLLAVGYAAHRIEQAALARKGYNTRDFWKPTPVVAAYVAHQIEAYTLTEERRDAKLFLDVPSAFWLDPNRYGDDPDWRKRLFPEPKKMPEQRYGSVFDYMLDEKKKDFSHGACPTCGAPCEHFTFRSHGYYSCTNKKCDKYEQGWGTHGRQIVLDNKARWIEKT